MEIIHKDTNKFTLPDNTKAKTKKLIKPDYYRDLSEQIKAVQKAIANERGENLDFDKSCVPASKSLTVS